MPRKKAEISQVIVTARDDAPKDRSILKTPEGQPDVQVLQTHWWTQVLVRGARAFLQNFIGYLLGAGVGVGVANAAEAVAATTGVVVPPEVHTWLTLLSAAFFAALGPTIVCMLQNTLEILTKLDVSAPKLRG